jgi:hypothetical protein
VKGADSIEFPVSLQQKNSQASRLSEQGRNLLAKGLASETASCRLGRAPTISSAERLLEEIFPARALQQRWPHPIRKYDERSQVPYDVPPLLQVLEVLVAATLLKVFHSVAMRLP